MCVKCGIIVTKSNETNELAFLRNTILSSYDQVIYWFLLIWIFNEL